MTREALDGDDLEARSGDGHNHAAGKEDTPNPTGQTRAPQEVRPNPEHPKRYAPNNGVGA
ncbi:hypothetical protein GCM10027590_68520 [Nocardiopsis nanhaiensis]